MISMANGTGPYAPTCLQVAQAASMCPERGVELLTGSGNTTNFSHDNKDRSWQVGSTYRPVRNHSVDLPSPPPPGSGHSSLRRLPVRNLRTLVGAVGICSVPWRSRLELTPSIRLRKVLSPGPPSPGSSPRSLSSCWDIVVQRPLLASQARQGASFVSTPSKSRAGQGAGPLEMPSALLARRCP